MENKIGTTTLAVSSVLVVILAGANPASAQELNKLTQAETAAGWKLLWDGTLAGRSSFLKGGTGGSTNPWGIDDNGLKDPNTGDPVSNGGDVFLYSKERYDNFEWRVDFKVNSGGNSGFFIRTQGDWYCDGFEIGILDSYDGGDADSRSHPENGDKLPAGILDYNTGKNFATGSNAPVKRSGAIYDMYPTTKDGVPIPKGGVYVDMMKPADAWNSMVVWANGNFVETWLNGVKVTDFEIGSQDYMNRYNRSKFGCNKTDCGTPPTRACGDDFGQLNTGNWAVQDHGGSLRVWLRNIKIRSFTPGSKLPSPLATPNGGTFAGETKVKLDAGVTGAAIRYTLDGSEPGETSNLYNDSTGLMISRSATVKSKAFRARFTSSDAATASFTISGTGINGKGSNLAPEVVLLQHGKRLNITNRNGIPFMVDLISLDGKRVRSLGLDRASDDLSLADLKSGVYLVKMHAGEWLHTRRIAVP